LLSNGDDRRIWLLEIAFSDINRRNFNVMQNAGGMEIMTKADLIENIYLKTEFSKKEAGDIIERVFGLIKSTLEGGGRI